VIKYPTESITAAGSNKHVASTMAGNIFQGEVPTSAQSGVTASWSSKIKKRVYRLLSALSQPGKLAGWFYFHFLSHSLEK